ncbi:MAG TPA: trypsin-like peptidase domain-containing protein [Vicinamibacterales bacterium]|nr:trypsin-like peptidase domain-containing protein [Vicinamibacterales bacterium]
MIMMKTGAAARVAIAAALGLSLQSLPARAQESSGRLDALQQLNGSVATLVKRVSQSVVQVIVTSYGPVDQSNGTNTDLVIGHQRSMGSGVVIASGGYIVTNAHVVSNARHVEVVLPGAASDAGGVKSLVKGRGRTVEATIVGVAREVDLALLKVDAPDLPALPVADYDTLRQGELVFAFGSPEGLRNSVTMGIVSAVARQPDQDNPLVYVQTDAPINHGSSGGPLVNVNGELVGINTFILSDSGGSQGLGFAIPGPLVQMAYPKLRRYGHLHRGEIGIQLQTITPTLAGGLGLAQDWGPMIADVAPESPAEKAGLKPQDIVVSVDGEPLDGVPRLAFHLFTRSAGDRITLGVLRGSDELSFTFTVGERAHDFDRLTDLVDPEKSLIAKLGILGVDITEATAGLAASVRLPSGVVVVGHTTNETQFTNAGLLTADTIHAINNHSVRSVDELRAAVDGLKPRSPVVLEIERAGQFIFLAFELD